MGTLKHTLIMKDTLHHIETAGILATFLAYGITIISIVGLLVLAMENL